MIRLAHVGAIGALVVVSTGLGLAARAAGTVAWQPPERISAEDGSSGRFPSLAVDQRARAHVVWCAGARVEPTPASPGDRSRREQLDYAVRDAAGWSAPRAIAVGQRLIYRNALAVDLQDRLHLLFDYSPGSGFDVYYRQAPADDGFTEGNWQHPQLLNFRWNSYLSDIAVRGNALNVVMDDAGALDAPCPACADIYFRRSIDGGETWSSPVSLRPSPVGSARPRIRVDPAGVLHVTWDEGWDHNSGGGVPNYSVYMLSPDGGDSWSTPTIVELPQGSSAQLAAAGDGRGGVLLVWRSAAEVSPGIYFQWSTDWGETWTEPAAIPAIMAGPWSAQDDRYDMALDAAGRIHLLAAGVTSAEQGRRALYHLEWDGERWSPPATVYDRAGVPEYPQLAIDGAGGAHATWHVRRSSDETVPSEIWYGHGRVVDAPPPPEGPPVVLARVLAPAPTPVPHPRRAEQNQPSINTDRVKILLISLLVGFVIAALTGRLVR